MYGFAYHWFLHFLRLSVYAYLSHTWFDNLTDCVVDVLSINRSSENVFSETLLLDLMHLVVH